MKKVRSYYKIYFSVFCLLTFTYGSSTVDEVTTDAEDAAKLKQSLLGKLFIRRLLTNLI